MWDRLRPAATGALTVTPQDLDSPSAVSANAILSPPEAQLPPSSSPLGHHQHDRTQKALPLSPRRPAPDTSGTRVSDSRTSSLLQPLFGRPTAALTRRGSRRTLLSSATKHLNTTTKDDGWQQEFDLLTGLGIDQNPTTTRRYEIRRGVAHRVDLSQQQSDDRPESSHTHSSRSSSSSSSSAAAAKHTPSPLKARSANVATRTDYGSTVADISPPSSPEISGRDHANLPDDRDVSPIDETNSGLSQLDIARAHHQRYLDEQRRKSESQKENQAPQDAGQRSFIPTMRREKRQNQQAATQNLRETKSRERLRNLSATKWDDMTGEPTATGRAGQVRPQEFAQQAGNRPQVQLRTPPQLRQDKNVVQSFGDRVRKLRNGGAPKNDPAAAATATANRPAISAPITAPVPLDQRPGWRGASGRTTLVDPVADTKLVPPLSIPRKSSKRVSSAGLRDLTAPSSSPPMHEPPASSHVSPPPPPSQPTAATSETLPGQQTPSPPPAPATDAAQPSQYVAQAYPSPPSGDDARMAPHAPTPAQTPILAIPNQEKAIRRKPPQNINPLGLNDPRRDPHMSYSSSVYSPQQTPVPTKKPPTPYAGDSPVDDHFSQAPAEAWVQPPSRFSVTTYATSAAAGSPRPSADIDLPPLPTPPSKVDSVMERKRPVCLGSTSPAINTDQPFKISMSSPYAASFGDSSPSPTAARAQLPSNANARATPRTPVPARDSRPDSMMSMSKALPLAPPELMSANDRVAHLNARLEALGNRRININTAIKQMTELMPQDNLMASDAVLHKREAEKRKVEALKAELSDVQREEYELGLKLHRAYKRLDKNAEYEPTTLWVRRVTG